MDLSAHLLSLHKAVLYSTISMEKCLRKIKSAEISATLQLAVQGHKEYRSTCLSGVISHQLSMFTLCFSKVESPPGLKYAQPHLTLLLPCPHWFLKSYKSLNVTFPMKTFSGCKCVSPLFLLNSSVILGSSLKVLIFCLPLFYTLNNKIGESQS